MSSLGAVSVIIPTTGLPARKDLLWRAIESVLSQEEVDPRPLVVLNGQEADRKLEQALASDSRLRLIRLSQASLPDSYLAGRGAVETPWFGELDDDDLLLPGALALRVKALSEDSEADVVVTNGYRRESGEDLLHVERMDEVARDPLQALIRQNWLLPGSWLARTETVGAGCFQDIPRYRECTFLAIQFVTRCRTVFRPEPTVVWNTDTPGSVTKTLDYLLCGPPALHRLLDLDLPTEVRAEYRKRLSQAHHAVARWYWERGQRIKAWRKHLVSLASPGGWRYLRFSARLLLPRPKG